MAPFYYALISQMDAKRMTADLRQGSRLRRVLPIKVSAVLIGL